MEREQIEQRERDRDIGLTTGFGVAGFHLVLLSLTLAPAIFRRGAEARAGSDGAPAPTALVTERPGAPARPASVH